MTETDPLVPALAEIVVDVLRFLDECGDEEVDPDTAVKMTEHVGWMLLQLPPEQVNRLLAVVAEMAEGEEEPGRREFLTAFPFACGLVEEAE